jgi:hypothetical protein
VDHIALEAELNGTPGCRCNDTRARLLAEIAGRDHACPTHSQAGRDGAEQRARINALAELARKARAENEQTVALNSRRLTDLVRAAFETPTESETTE